MTDILQDMRDIIRTDGGRRVLMYIIEASGIETSPFTGDRTRDTFDAGRRQLGAQIVSLAKEADFDLYLKALKENNDVTN